MKLQAFRSRLGFPALFLSAISFAVPAFSQSIFIDATALGHIDHQYTGHLYGGGAACGDFNGDGFLDLYVLSGKDQPNLLYLNNGNGIFTETAQSAGVADEAMCIGAVCGDLDLFVVNFLGANRLYRNDGAAHFTDVAEAAGVADAKPGISAALADYDNDGWLDIYVINYSTTNPSSVFYRNNGNGTFSDVTAATRTGVQGRSLGLGFFDFDLDGDQDLYVVDEHDLDHLFRYNGDGTFTNLATEAHLVETDGMGSFMGGEYKGEGHGSVHADFNRDGYRDVFFVCGARVASGGYFYQMSVVSAREKA